MSCRRHIPACRSPHWDTGKRTPPDIRLLLFLQLPFLLLISLFHFAFFPSIPEQVLPAPPLFVTPILSKRRSSKRQTTACDINRFVPASIYPRSPLTDKAYTSGNISSSHAFGLIGIPPPRGSHRAALVHTRTEVP